MTTRTIDLTIALRPYDLVRPVREVGVSGAALRFEEVAEPPTVAAALSDPHADVLELDLADYVAYRADGGRDLVALPIFPSRRFVHRTLVVGPDVRSVGDLAGARIAVEDARSTTTVWVRALLRAGYDVDPGSVTWVGPGVAADAAIREPVSVADDRLRALFDPPGSAEREDVRRLGVFPIHDVVVMRQELLAAERWLAGNVFRAFEVARRRYFYRLTDIKASRLPVPSVAGHALSLRQWLGQDIWPYGVTGNRVSLQAFLDDASPAAMTKLGVDDLFHPVEPYVDGR